MKKHGFWKLYPNVSNIRWDKGMDTWKCPIYVALAIGGLPKQMKDKSEKEKIAID